MSNTQLKNLALSLGIIGLIALIVTFVTIVQNNNKTKPLIISNDEITKVEVKTTASNFTLEKLDSTWSVNEFDADQDKIDELLATLKKTNITEIASTNANNYTTFLVDDASGATVNLYKSDGAKIITLVIGKPSTVGSYVRLEGDSNVYRVDQNLSETFESPLNDFRDKTLSKGSIDNLEKIVTKLFTLNKTAEGYKFNKSTINVDQTKAQDFATNLINIEAFDIAADDEAAKVKKLKPTLTFQIAFTDGNLYIFDVYKVGSSYFVRREKDNTILQIDESQYSTMNKVAKDLMS